MKRHLVIASLLGFLAAIGYFGGQPTVREVYAQTYPTLKSTRFFHSTGGFACTNTGNQTNWQISVGIDGHAGLTDPYINIVKIWMGNFAYIGDGQGGMQRSWNSVVNVFQMSYQGVPFPNNHGKLMFQMDRQAKEKLMDLGPIGMRVYQADTLAITFSCDSWPGQPVVQDVAGWIWYY